MAELTGDHGLELGTRTERRHRVARTFTSLPGPSGCVPHAVPLRFSKTPKPVMVKRSPRYELPAPIVVDDQFDCLGGGLDPASSFFGQLVVKLCLVRGYLASRCEPSGIWSAKHGETSEPKRPSSTKIGGMFSETSRRTRYAGGQIQNPPVWRSERFIPEGLPIIVEVSAPRDATSRTAEIATTWRNVRPISSRPSIRRQRVVVVNRRHHEGLRRSPSDPRLTVSFQPGMLLQPLPQQFDVGLFDLCSKQTRLAGVAAEDVGNRERSPPESHGRGSIPTPRARGTNRYRSRVGGDQHRDPVRRGLVENGRIRVGAPGGEQSILETRSGTPLKGTRRG